MPSDDGLGFSNHQGGPPITPHSREENPERAVTLAQVNALDRALKDVQLLPERQVLNGQVGAMTAACSEQELQGCYGVLAVWSRCRSGPSS